MIVGQAPAAESNVTVRTVDTSPSSPPATTTSMPPRLPDELLRIRWCEAGSYLNQPRWQTNYRARTHGEQGSSGGYQILGSTWRTWAKHVPGANRWTVAYRAPADIQDKVALWGWQHSSPHGRPWYASRRCWAR